MWLGGDIMIQRIFNFCWTHCVIFIPISFLLFFIVDLQRDFIYIGYLSNGPLMGPNSNIMTPFYLFLIYVITNIYTIPMFFCDGIYMWLTEFLIPLIPLVAYPFLISFIDKKIRIIILLVLYPFIALVCNYNDEIVGFLILQAFGLTLYDFIIRQKIKNLVVKSNDIELKLNFIDILERNIVKVVCLSFVIVPLIYYLKTKEILWDKITNTHNN